MLTRRFLCTASAEFHNKPNSETEITDRHITLVVQLLPRPPLRDDIRLYFGVVNGKTSRVSVYLFTSSNRVFSLLFFFLFPQER